MKMIAGVDEAGRGPVVGNMVMAIAAIEPEKEEDLKRMGVKDSKLIPPAKRELLAETLQEMLPNEIISITAEEIDQVVGNSNGDSLNKLEARTTALLIYNLSESVELEKVIIDSPQVSCDKYERLIRTELKKIDVEGRTKNILLQCEIKADLNYPIVGAASILAKVARDATIRELEKEHGPIGSGYMTDPRTQEFLERTFKEGHTFFRKSWSSFRNLVERAGQSSLEDFAAKRAKKHEQEIKEFEVLKEHGFIFQEPTNPYEVVRMRKGKTTVIKYSTGKVLVQGPKGEKETVEALLAELNL